MAWHRKPTRFDDPWPRRCRALRAALKVEADELASKVGVAPKTWYYYEIGRQSPSRAVALLISLLERGTITLAALHAENLQSCS